MNADGRDDRADLSEPAARVVELCRRPVVVVLLGWSLVDIGYCGIPDGGAVRGSCSLCGGDLDEHEKLRCPGYTPDPVGRENSWLVGNDPV